MRHRSHRKNFLKTQQRGAAIVEVALLVALIAVIGMVSIRAVGIDVTRTMYHMQAGLDAGTGSVYYTAWCQFGNPSDPICL